AEPPPEVRGRRERARGHSVRGQLGGPEARGVSLRGFSPEDADGPAYGRGRRVYCSRIARAASWELPIAGFLAVDSFFASRLASAFSAGSGAGTSMTVLPEGTSPPSRMEDGEGVPPSSCSASSMAATDSSSVPSPALAAGLGIGVGLLTGV